MMLFWTIVGITILVTLYILARPLLRQSLLREDDRVQQNIKIAKERLGELEQEFKGNTLSRSEYEKIRDELEKGLLIDIDLSQKDSSASVSHVSRRYAFILLIFIPLISLSLYLTLGNPELINVQGQTAMSGTENPHAQAKNKKLASVEEMVAKLAKRLESDKDNGEGWYLLGRSYLSLGNFTEAARALERAHQLLGDDPGLLLRYADALAMSRNGQISGKPFELVQKALTMNPNDPTGLWLAGMGYEEQGKYRQAAETWNKLLPVLRDEPSREKVRNMIARVNSQLGDNPVEITAPARASVATRGVPVSVDIADELKNKVPADATVFIFARAQNGSRMPLAVVRKQVKDLPVSVTLDDAMAMTETMRLSQFSAVNIVARVSTSGSAMPQKGDYQSDTLVAQPGQQEPVKLVISQQLP